MNYQNQATFERCAHDRINPYAMVSRELINDTSISPNARITLIYMLSFKDGWKFFHSQLQKGIGIGERALNSAIQELINAGYADRTRERIKGIYQPYKYTIREFKKSLPNCIIQPGSSSLGDAVQCITNNTDTEKPVVVVLEKEDKQSKTFLNPKTKEKQKICKSDVYHWSLASKKDWQSWEIEEAWDVYEKCDNKISDVLLYIDGIISKKRLLRDNKTEKSRGKKCPKSKQITAENSKKNIESEEKEECKNFNEILDKDTWEQVFRKSRLSY